MLLPNPDAEMQLFKVSSNHLQYSKQMETPSEINVPL